MSDDYLFDGAGSDPDVERLEAVLRPHEYGGELPPLPDRAVMRRRSRAGTWLSVAALLGLAVGGAWWAQRSSEEPRANSPARTVAQAGEMSAETETGPAWQVVGRSGVPSCGGRPAKGGVCDLRVGQWLETDAETSAHLAVADIGHMDVRPNTRVQLKQTGTREHRLHLEEGALHAVVDAPPRLLVVETPGAVAVDLGCEYTLSVDASGDGTLDVYTGWVALERDARAVFVPAGATARMSAAGDLGIPFFRDAPPSLVALGELAVGGVPSQGSPSEGSLTEAVAASRPRDTLSLWHLLPMVPVSARGAVFDRIVALEPSLDQDDSLRAAALALDPAALERSRSHLESHWAPSPYPQPRDGENE